MMHHMKLKKSPFLKIKNSSKTIELRLNDEKRQQVLDKFCLGIEDDKTIRILGE